MISNVTLCHAAGCKTPATCRRTGVGSCAQDAAWRGIAVRYVEAGDLVVAVVLKSCRPQQARVDRGRRITALSEDPDGLVGRIRVVGVHAEQVGRVEGVALGVQGVANVLDGDQQIVR